MTLWRYKTGFLLSFALHASAQREVEALLIQLTRVKDLLQILRHGLVQKLKF